MEISLMAMPAKLLILGPEGIDFAPKMDKFKLTCQYHVRVYAYPAPATKNQMPGLVPGFLVPAKSPFDVRFTIETSRSPDMMVTGCY